MPRLPTPILYTERFILRPPRLRDSWKLYRCLREPGMRSFLRTSKALRPWHGVLFVLRAALGRWRGRRVDYVTVLRETGEVIGCRSVFNLRLAEPRSGESGAWVAKPYWSMGVSPECGDAFVPYLFGTLGLHRLIFRFLEENTAVKKSAAKGGNVFTYEGTLREDAWRDGVFSNLHQFSLLREDAWRDGAFHNMHQFSLLRTDEKVVSMLGPPVQAGPQPA